ncbi:hypothetical protein RA955_04965 [Geobacillus proteiniphilus]|nr:hypothetical protein [Geobacillus proteiniphilus]WMJ17450.1 hypothetical protein RA955_04965 [Geobacillus proteiniphilus]
MANNKGVMAVTDRNDNRKRKNKYTNNREEIANEWVTKKEVSEAVSRSGTSPDKQ